MRDTDERNQAKKAKEGTELLHQGEEELMMPGEDGETAQVSEAVLLAASGKSVDMVVEGEEETRTFTREFADEIYDFRRKLLAFCCRPDWSEADKQKACKFTLKCALVHHRTMPLGKMDACFQRSFTNVMMDYLGLRKPYGNTPAAAPEKRFSLTARGLNIQWPFSQLILGGVKTVEVRRYPLGHRNPNILADELVWLIETRGTPNASANAIVDSFSVGDRPRRAQIVGIIAFSTSECYTDMKAFREDARSHCIKQGSDMDWDGKGEMFAWNIDLSLIHI